jgi:hypothetical protein
MFLSTVGRGERFFLTVIPAKLVPVKVGRGNPWCVELELNVWFLKCACYGSQINAEGVYLG